MLLTVSGPPGSGKSTNAAALAEQFGLEHVSGGDIFRELADERGYTPVEFNELAETDEQIDRISTADSERSPSTARISCSNPGSLAGSPRITPTSKSGSMPRSKFGPNVLPTARTNRSNAPAPRPPAAKTANRSGTRSTTTSTSRI